MSKPGMIETLESAAEIIEESARVLRCEFFDYFERKRWGSQHAKARYQTQVAIAKNLRKIAAYHKVNPLGGPAKVFDAIADRIRAGEKCVDVLADYGFRTVKVRK